jgi:hypothetical protein
MTFSADDTHWQSLQKHLPRYEEWLAADDKAKLAISTANLRSNPQIAAYHFHQRSVFFTGTFLQEEFGIIDYCFCYERRA